MIARADLACVGIGMSTNPKHIIIVHMQTYLTSLVGKLFKLCVGPVIIVTLHPSCMCVCSVHVCELCVVKESCPN